MTTHVRDVMSTDVMTLSPNHKLASAEEVMKLERVRHLPVVDEGDLVGIVSQRDIFHSALLKALGYGTHGVDKLLGMFLIKEAMVTEVVTIGPDATLAEAADVMAERRIGCLPVLDGDDLVGILTETDFVKMYAAKAATSSVRD